MKSKNKAAKKIEMDSILFYAITQLLLLAMILVMAVVLYEYQDGKRQASYDEGYVKKEETTFDVTRNKNEPENILLVMDESLTEKRGQATQIAVVQNDSKTKQVKIVSFLKELPLEVNGQSASLAELYQTGGVALLSDALKNNFQLKVTHYVVMTPYTFTKWLTHSVPKSMTFDGQKNLSAKKLYEEWHDPALSEVSQINKEAVFTKEWLKQMFTVKNLGHLPGMIGSFFGYADTNMPLSMVTSKTRNLLLTDKKELQHLVVPIEVQEDQAFESLGRVDVERNKEKILRIFE